MRNQKELPLSYRKYALSTCCSSQNPVSPALKRLYQNLRAGAHVILCRLQKQWWSTKGQEMQAYADTSDMHNFYNAVKTIHGPKNYNLMPLRSSDGLTLIKDQKLVLERRAEHFKGLLNQS